MDIDLAALPDDVETLHRMVRSLAAERTALAAAQAQIERLQLIVQKLQHNQFGRSAERLDDEQPVVTGHVDLAADDVDAEVERHGVLGAREVRRTPHWVTLLDPAGRAYCVTRRKPA